MRYEGLHDDCPIDVVHDHDFDAPAGRCRYDDCVNGLPVADDEQQVTCPACRRYMGLPEVREYAGDDPTFLQAMTVTFTWRASEDDMPVKRGELVEELWEFAAAQGVTATVRGQTAADVADAYRAREGS